MHLFEKKLDSKLIYDGKILTLTKDTVELENGKTATREFIHHNGAVCVVPITDNNEIIFVKQFRYPFGDVILEVPAGKIDNDEDHYEGCKRELLEETGAKASEMTYMGAMYPSVAYTNEQIHMYYAKGLVFTCQNLDDDEFLDIIKIPFEEAIDLIMTNKICDAKTQIAVLKAARLLNK